MKINNYTILLWILYFSHLPASVQISWNGMSVWQSNWCLKNQIKSRLNRNVDTADYTPTIESKIAMSCICRLVKIMNKGTPKIKHQWILISNIEYFDMTQKKTSIGHKKCFDDLEPLTSEVFILNHVWLIVALKSYLPRHKIYDNKDMY